MKYDNITRAVFLKRPNRFIAEVNIDGHREGKEFIRRKISNA
jgi:sugar fermentation stimulation protein A